MRQLKIRPNDITNRTERSLEKYLQEISKIELLKPEEEVRLTQLVKQGDKKAYEKLVRGNLRFVVSVAKQYQNQGMPLPDLINEGNLGLTKAAHRFDETKGFKFISYAVWWIRQSILQALAENSRMVAIPLNKLGAKNKVIRKTDELEQKLGREPTPEEIGEELKITDEKVLGLLSIGIFHVSLDKPLIEGEDQTLMDILTDDEFKIDPDMRIDSLKKVLLPLIEKKLKPYEQKIIKGLFGIDSNKKSKEELGVEMDITPERVRQIKDRAILKLQKSKSYLKEYL